MDDLSWLESMVADDDIGLLNVKKKNSAPSADEQLVSKFNEVNEFVLKHGNEPEANMTNVSEYMLASRLKAIRENHEQSMALADYDIHDLLPEHQE
jgi:hypothetical protein